MAMRSAAAVSRASILRRASRYFSDGKSGKVLSEEERAAENIYIQKIEREKLEKLAHKGYKPEEQPTPTAAAAAAADAKPSSPASTTSGVSTDKDRNYAVLAGVVAAAAALGWYLKSNAKKLEVQD